MSQSNISPQQKKSLTCWGLFFTFAAIVWPLVYQVLMERMHLEPGSVMNGLLKSSKMTMPGAIAMGMLVTLMKAIGIADGVGAATDDTESSK